MIKKVAYRSKIYRHNCPKSDKQPIVVFNSAKSETFTRQSVR